MCAGKDHLLRVGPFIIARRYIYMAALVAARVNPVIRQMYLRLREAGRPTKVALTACMRKLLTILNAIVRDRKAWEVRA
jgi:transposase